MLKCKWHINDIPGCKMKVNVHMKLNKFMTCNLCSKCHSAASESLSVFTQNAFRLFIELSVTHILAAFRAQYKITAGMFSVMEEEK